MKTRMRSKWWAVAGVFLVLGVWICWAAVEASAAESDLAYYRQAKINWRQFEGQKLTIGLNKHPYTESLLPLIPEFEALTGVKVDYLILPANEYGAKLTADLSNQRGELTVIMAGAMRNWAYVPPGWMVPLEQFLNDPKLTDRSWYKLEDFFPSLVSANRWNGRIGGGTGEGPLWSIPVMSESYVLAYRKDIFDKFKIKVPRTYEELAEAVGIHSMRVKILSFTVSCFLAGVGGVLYATYIGFLSPEVTDYHVSFDALIYIMIGGVGTMVGPIIGTLLIVTLPEALQIAAEYRLLFYGLILIVMIIYLPRGIVGWARDWKSRREKAEVAWKRS